MPAAIGGSVFGQLDAALGDQRAQRRSGGSLQGANPSRPDVPRG